VPKLSPPATAHFHAASLRRLSAPSRQAFDIFCRSFLSPTFAFCLMFTTPLPSASPASLPPHNESRSIIQE